MSNADYRWQQAAELLRRGAEPRRFIQVSPRHVRSVRRSRDQVVAQLRYHTFLPAPASDRDLSLDVEATEQRIGRLAAAIEAKPHGSPVIRRTGVPTEYPAERPALASANRPRHPSTSRRDEGVEVQAVDEHTP
jgi:hypothetical protein